MRNIPKPSEAPPIHPHGLQRDSPEPRWPAVVAALAAGGLYAALPEHLAVGPRWLPAAVVAVLIVPLLITHRHGRHSLNQILGHVVAGALTVFIVWSLVLLLLALPQRREGPADLLRSAAALWGSNVLVFALWYWRLDAGGPHRRDARLGHADGSFLFPQMTLKMERWSPNFIDYLFLAFNTSTAFSPTDTPVLNRWAKSLTMIQATIALATIATLAARAVNIM